MTQKSQDDVQHPTELALPRSEVTNQSNNSDDSGKPGQIHFEIEVKGLPKELTLSVLEKVLNPKKTSILTTLKDLATIVISIATVIISYQVAEATRTFNDQTTKINTANALAAASETEGKLVALFSPKVRNETDAQKVDRLSASAMQIAVYGKPALDAVKVALSSQNPDIRNGSELVVKEMYLTEIVEPSFLTNSYMLINYKNPSLRLGVMEWAEKMNTDLSEKDSQEFFDAIILNFGDKGQACEKNQAEVARLTGEFFLTHPFPNSYPLTLGLIKNCPADDSYDKARQQAVLALPRIAEKLPASDRQLIVADLGQVFTNSKDQQLKDDIEQSIQSIKK